jgi:hypothetical protein
VGFVDARKRQSHRAGKIDGTVPADVLAKVHEIPKVQQIKPLQFRLRWAEAIFGDSPHRASGAHQTILTLLKILRLSFSSSSPATVSSRFPRQIYLKSGISNRYNESAVAILKHN